MPVRFHMDDFAHCIGAAEDFRCLAFSDDKAVGAAEGLLPCFPVLMGN